MLPSTMPSSTPSLLALSRKILQSADAGSSASTLKPSRTSGRLLRPVPAPASKIVTSPGAPSERAMSMALASACLPNKGGVRVSTQCWYSSSNDAASATTFQVRLVLGDGSHSYVTSTRELDDTA